MSGRLVRNRLRASAASVGMLAGMVPVVSFAQDTPPPSRFILDDNGVNLATGTRNQREVEVSAGAGRAAITSYVTRRGTGLTKSDFDLSVYQSGSGLSFAILGPNGQESELFSQNGSTFTSVEGDGATVTLSGSTYTLIVADGTKYYYSTNLTTPDSARLARATQIVQPNGDSYTMNWLNTSNCVNQYQSGCSGPNANTFAHKIVRLASVTNAYGYALGYTYKSNYVGDATWGTLSKVTAYNTLADTAQTWPSVSYSQSQSGGTSTLTATDALNQTTTYTSSSGRDAVRLPGSSSDDLVVTTDTYGQVTSITKGGKTWQYAFSYSAPNRSVTITNPDGTTRQVVSDANVGLPRSVTDEDGNTYSYDYDSSGRLTLTTAPDGHKTKLTYNDRGGVTETRIISATPGTPADLVSTATYDATCTNVLTCNMPSKTFDANQRETDYSYDPIFGAVTKVIYPADNNGVHPETRYTYTGQQSPTGGTVYLLTATSSCRTQASCSGSSDETKTTITYGIAAGKNNLLAISSTTAAGDGSLSSTTGLQYDLVGNLTGVDGPLSGTGDTTNLTYDAMRRRTAVITADPDGSGPLNRRAVVYHYLPNGLVDKVSAGTTDTGGGNFNALQQTNISYDSYLRKTKTVITAANTTYSVTQYGFDAMNRLQCVATRMDPNQWSSQADPCAPQTNGANGPDRITYTHYEPAGRPDYVTTGYGTSVAATEATVQYSVLGSPRTAKDANNNTTTYTYDGFGRLQTTTYPGGSYEQLGYDASGNVTSRRLRDGQVIGYSYDALGRLVSQDNPNGVYWETDKSYGYDLLGQLTSASDSNGRSLTFGYDALGRRVSQGDSWFGPGHATFQYDAAGRRTRLSWWDGMFVSYEYDAAGELTAIRENGGLVLASFGYDDFGRRTRLTRGNGTVATYSYDPVSRLSSLTDDLAGGAWDQAVTLSYNAAGQVSGRTGSNDTYAFTGHYNVDRGYGVNALNQLTSAGSVALGYDGRGNLTQSGGDGYGYTSENRLASAPGANLAYDPLGRLFNIAYEAGVNTSLVYDGVDVLGEVNQVDGSLLRRYVYGPGSDEPLVWYEGAGTGTRRYLHADERGSVVAVSDDGGAAVAINRYDEYGIPQSSNVGRFQYTGQKWLPSIGLYDYKARMYSPTLGRFMQTDPIGYADGMNWYNYVKGDPVNAIDPTGLYDYPCGTVNTSHQEGTDWVVSGHDLICHGPDYQTQLTYGGDGGGAVGPGFGRDGGGGAAPQPQSRLPVPKRGVKIGRDPCSSVLAQTGEVLAVDASGSFIAGTGPTGAIGHFTNLETGSSGYYYTVGGGVGVDLGVSGTGGVYRSINDLNGGNYNVAWGFGVGLSVHLSQSDFSFVGLSITVGARGSAGSGTVTQTHLFGCTLGGGQ